MLRGICSELKGRIGVGGRYGVSQMYEFLENKYKFQNSTVITTLITGGSNDDSTGN